MKLKFTDSKKCNLIFKDDKGAMVLTEDVYEHLLRKAYKGTALGDFYDLNSVCSDIFDNVYTALGYPTDTTWFIHPDVLRDNDKMKALYEAVREDVIEKLNEDDEDLRYRLRSDENFESMKDIFNIRYTFIDKKYIKDDFTEESDDEILEGEGVDEDEENSGQDELEEGEDKLLNSTCKEYLEEFEKKLKKTDPRYYLIEMALGKSKGWAYIKKAEDLKGDPERDVVTPKNAKKILALSEQESN